MLVVLQPGFVDLDAQGANKPQARLLVGEDASDARAPLDLLVHALAWLKRWERRYPKPTNWAEEHIGQTLTFYRLPRQHHKHLKSTNLLAKPSARPSGRAARRSSAVPEAVVVGLARHVIERVA